MPQKSCSQIDAGLSRGITIFMSADLKTAFTEQPIPA
jgi:hypothetical protein